MSKHTSTPRRHMKPAPIPRFPGVSPHGHPGSKRIRCNDRMCVHHDGMFHCFDPLVMRGGSSACGPRLYTHPYVGGGSVVRNDRQS